jgi:hypothetical protein
MDSLLQDLRLCPSADSRKPSSIAEILAWSAGHRLQGEIYTTNVLHGKSECDAHAQRHR